jgi:hypothetical protein
MRLRQLIESTDTGSVEPERNTPLMSRKIITITSL